MSTRLPTNASSDTSISEPRKPATSSTANAGQTGLMKYDVERQQRVRRPGRRVVREGLDAGFEPAKHGGSPQIDSAPRRGCVLRPARRRRRDRAQRATIAAAMAYQGARAPQCLSGPVCGRARKRAGDRQRSITALISIMAAAPRDVVASSAAAHSTPAFGAPARRRRLLPRSAATARDASAPRSTDGHAGKSSRRAQGSARALGSRRCATTCARPSSGWRRSCRRRRRSATAPAGTLRAHAVDARRSRRRAGRRRHHEPDRGAACSRRPASTPPPCTASSRPSSASRSPAPRTIRASGPRACRSSPIRVNPQRAHRAHEHAHGRDQQNGGSAAAAT